MNEQNKNENSPVSMLRKDLVSGTWVVLSTRRRERPDFSKINNNNLELPKDSEKCPFCPENVFSQEKDVLIYVNDTGDWSLKVFPNKFPAFSSKVKNVNRQEVGPFETMEGAGYHEVLATRDHSKDIADLDVIQIAEIMDAFQERYVDLMNKRHIKYISIFKNYGKDAGASIGHPHCQIVAMPIIDPDVYRSLVGSESYFMAHRECVHCVMIEWEKQVKERIIYENEEFIVVCPFVSRVSFETRIYPKKHLSYFERITDEQKIMLADAMKQCLLKLKKALGNPPYNMFLHTSPCDGQAYDHYHWHFEIFPKTNIWAGLELSTGIEICSVLPEEAAKILRK